MKTMHMIVDVEKCVGCFNCMLACKDEHVGNRWMPYTDEQRKHGDKWINPTSYERGKAPYTEFCFVTRTCYQCDNPACMEKFPDEIYKREDGIVIIDPQKAKGKKEIVGACPYGQIHWNEERNLPQKCTGCAHLIDEGWERPRCVQACPLRAINTVYCEEDEWEKIIVNQGLKSITPDDGNKPRVLYKNLYRYNRCFIKGAIFFESSKVEEPAVDADVALYLNGMFIDKMRSDFLGEYYFDRIPKNSGKFVLKIALEGFDPIEKEVEVGAESVVVDEIKLKKSAKKKSDSAKQEE